MSIPLLNYTPSSQNQRVAAMTVANDDQPRVFSTDNILSPTEMDYLIEAAYRQMFFHAFAADREAVLESQLRNGQISVRDFIRGLVLSDTYRRSFYDLNNNYRFVEQTIQRVLGRDPYSEREKIAWSIVVVNKGIVGFIDDLLNTDEYLNAFGYDTVPYQRRRNLPGRSSGELPFNIKSPRYEAYHRSQLGFPQIMWQTSVRRFVPQEQQPRAGSPANFMAMAQSISARGNNPQTPNTANLDYMNAVPKKR